MKEEYVALIEFVLLGDKIYKPRDTVLLTKEEAEPYLTAGFVIKKTTPKKKVAAKEAADNGDE